MASLKNHFEAGGFGPSGLSDGYGEHPFHESRALIEDYLEGLSFSENPRFTKLLGAMSYALFAGGERVRPILCMEVARSLGSDPADVLPSAAAMELIHTGSLIHDDLQALGGDGLRSKIPPCHEEFDDATAILAGDACFSESVALISTYQKGTPRQLVEVIEELAAVTGASGMIGGQVLSTMDHGALEADSEAFESMHYYRTGVLIEASARIGAILAGASAKEKEEITEYARKLGVCLRVASDTPEAASASEDQEKVTFVRVYGLSEARRLADEALREALESLARLDADTRWLAEMARLMRFGTSTSVA